MNLEEVTEALDAAVFAKTGRHLSQVETVLLQGAYQGKTYEQMAETCQYSLTYLKQAAGPKLWKLLSEVLGEEVSKTNFRAVIERQWRFSFEKTKLSTSISEGAKVVSPSNTLLKEQRYRDRQRLRHSVSDIALPQALAAGVSNANTCQSGDWGEAPDVSIFYGRIKELATLDQWIVKERCRLVALLGMGGMGKTALSVKLAEQIQDEFEYVIWRSLRKAPPLEEILTELIQFLAPQQEASLPKTSHGLVSRLSECLHQHRCLVILDNYESILQKGVHAGKYRSGYESYSHLLRCI